MRYLLQLFSQLLMDTNSYNAYHYFKLITLGSWLFCKINSLGCFRQIYNFFIYIIAYILTGFEERVTKEPFYVLLKMLQEPEHDF